MKILDPQAGMALLSNKETLYRRLLQRFLQSQQQGIYNIDLLLGKNQEDAARAAHSIKGLSLNLGASQLHHHAQQLDTLFKQNKIDEVKQQLPNYQACFAETVTAIEDWLEENPGE